MRRGSPSQHPPKKKNCAIQRRGPRVVLGMTKFRYLALLAVLVVAPFLLAACGSGGGY